MRNRISICVAVVLACVALAGGASPASSLRVCALMQSRDGEVRRVGLVDKTTGQSFVIEEGTSRRGIRVVAIDMALEQVQIESGGSNVVLRLAGMEAGEAKMLPPENKKIPRERLIDNPEQERLIRGDVVKLADPPPGFELLLSRP